MSRLKQDGEQQPLANAEGLISKVGIAMNDLSTQFMVLTLQMKMLINLSDPSGGISRAIDREPQARAKIDGISVSRPGGSPTDEQRGVAAAR